MNSNDEAKKRNQKDDEKFAEQVDKFLAGKMQIYETLSLGHTPNIIKLLGSKAPLLTITQNVIRNSMLDESQRANRHLTGHNIPSYFYIWQR